MRRRGEVLLVYRPKYGDWTFPKGKAEPGESDEECALREVDEETGLRCEAGRLVGTTSYTDRHGRPKTVRFFELTVLHGEFAANNEVDELRWLAPVDAMALLTYAPERELVGRLDA